MNQKYKLYYLGKHNGELMWTPDENIKEAFEALKKENE